MNYTINIDRLMLDNMSPREIEQFKQNLQKEIASQINPTQKNGTDQKPLNKQTNIATSVAANVVQKINRAESARNRS